MSTKDKMQIIINATAAHTSGALTILNDFMTYVYDNEDIDCNFHLITTTRSKFERKENVLVYELSFKGWIARLFWDRFGLQHWLNKNNILPDTIISFQNTCSHLSGKYRKVKWLVYYHQPLPLVKYRWKLFCRDEYKLFLYSHFYAFFVNRWNKNAKYVVQLPYIKQLFCQKFKNINPEKVYVIRPNFPKINIEKIEKKEIDENRILLLYPAIPVRYKNHKIILDALELLRNEDIECYNKITVIFTISNDTVISKEILSRKLDSSIKCIGNISYEELLTYYKRSDGLLFPSKIETFGLPLIEASMFGKTILSSDLPYAREVLENVENCCFINSDDAEGWKNAIRQLVSQPKSYVPLSIKKKNTWEDFIKILNS